jgi:DNA-binding winged helix-turn-helix (wHTH) protein
MAAMHVQVEDASTYPATLWPIPILNWPEDAAENAALARERRPRLLLVARGAEVPVDFDGLSDWVRKPAEARDIYARVEVLQRRVERPFGVHIDADGLLRRGRAWIALSPVEARLMAALLAKPGAVVGRGDLLAAGWPERRIAANALQPRLSRLRARIGALGVRIVNVRQRGYALAIEPAIEHDGRNGAGRRDPR